MVESYLALKKEGSAFLGFMWMNLENMVLSEIIQTRRAAYCLSPLIEMSGTGKSMEMKGD